MKNLIIVRHGKCGFDKHLSPHGQEQIFCLARKLKEMVDGGSVTILTSVADRARESAEIIGKILNVIIEEHEALWVGYHRPENLPRTLELVLSKKDAETLILVTHLEHVKMFPEYFGREELGVSFSDEGEIPEGTAWFIDCEAKTITFVTYL